MSTALGRLQPAEVGKKVIYDAPEKTISALLSNQDAMVDAIKALCAKLDFDALGSANYAASISNSLSKIVLTE
jgi:hypothetical protein